LPTLNFDPSRTAAALGAQLRFGRLDPCGLVEESLAALADYPDKAIFIEVTAARARKEAASRARLRAGLRYANISRGLLPRVLREAEHGPHSD
jgi:Asp-tRNA(Asn)/Glu-tRNA(Gln) amidotransferase A subunit family amidase